MRCVFDAPIGRARKPLERARKREARATVAAMLSLSRATRAETRVVPLRAKRKAEEMLRAGIIDPTKVTKNALQNAASIAGLMLTTEAMVSEIKEKEKAPEGMPGGGGMGGMY